jgi:hypothetical protein
MVASQQTANEESVRMEDSFAAIVRAILTTNWRAPMHAVTRSLLSALALCGLSAPALRAAGSCSAQDRDALLVGAIAVGVRNRAHQNSVAGRCFTVSIAWSDVSIEPAEPPDRVIARARRVVHPYRVATRADSIRKEIEGCTSWVDVTVGEPRCQGSVASVQAEGEHCAPVFERVGRHWERRPYPCE